MVKIKKIKTKSKLLLVIALLLSVYGYSQRDTLQSRVVLVGDAGGIHNDGTHPVISLIRKNVPIDKKTVVVFLGDNLYHTGLPDEQEATYNHSRAVIDSQVSIVQKTEARAYFIPGNHDWNRGHAGGWEAILREQRYIDLLSGNNVEFFPKDGCAGPVEITVSKDVTLVIFDSQWWIHQYDKPGIESDCPYRTQTEVLSQLDDILKRNSDKFVILACHHPFRSYGIHGGYFRLKQHIFPLTEMWPNLYIPMPGIGTIYPIARGVFGTPQDLKHPLYQNMIRDVENVARQHPNLVFVAGHEHNLQMIRDSNYTYIVSGSGTKSTRVSKHVDAPFTTPDRGFALLEISRNKNVDVSFFTINKDSSGLAYKEHLMNFNKPFTITDTVNTKSTPEAVVFKNTVSVAANSRYDTASGFKRWMLGDNYRKEWATPVTMRVFNISKEKGGFKIEGLGGGKQTKSLSLRDKNGREWVLRTVNKDPELAIPQSLRGSLAQDIVQDLISTAHPYAPSTIPTLAKALNVVVPKAEFFFVPNDPALGIYRPVFANTVAMLEEREPGSKADDTKSTAKVINKIIEDNEHHIDQEAVLNARLLDMLVADWDRHFDQWRFGTHDTGKGKLYYPIARDRDQALFNSDGLLLKLLSQNAFPFLRGFKADTRRVNWLNWEARDFDRLFMNNLSKRDWESAVENFKVKLTDSVIEKAVKQMPPEIFAIRGQEIIKTLKSRRDRLAKSEAMGYFKFLNEEVNVVGSNKHEYFRVKNMEDGIHITVYKRKGSTDSSTVMFNRRFRNNETKEVRLYGLNGDDIFDVDEDVRSKIKLRMIGGRGDDTFNVKGNIKNLVYDFVGDSNYIVNPKNTKNLMANDPSGNQFDITGYNYNIYRFPRITVGYNPEDRLMVGLGFSRQTHSFRKEPYASRQRLSTLYALNKGSYQIKYTGEFNHVTRTGDLLFNADYVHPVLNNFFGLGNDTKMVFDREYYRVRYNYLQAELLYRKRPFSVVSIGAGPKFYHYWNRPDDNTGKILSSPSVVGLDSSRVYSTKTYVGGKAFILIDNLNSELLPTRGVFWNTEFNALHGAGNRSRSYTSITTDLTLYSSLTEPAKVVAVLRAGGGHIFSKDFEYFQALNLGQNNFLRGFRKNRFSGSGLMYGSIEGRVKLFDLKSYLVPGTIGIVGFTDVGRVWLRGEESKKWHHTYGAGLYFTPYNLLLLSATVGISDEEKLFNFSIGTRFNITF